MTNVQAPTTRLRLTEALPTVDAWVDWLASLVVPVLGSTADALERLRAKEDDVDAHGIAEMVSNDPLMTVKILAHAASHQGNRVVTDAETVTEALVMMGISPFFRAFGQQPTVESWLLDEPVALDAVRTTIERSHRGANLALAFAVQRMDPDAATMHAVALIHDFTDLLLWCHAPALQMRVATTRQADPTLRSTATQEQVLHVDVMDLQAELSRRWRLPSLLTRTDSGRHVEDARRRTIELAARLARHVPLGWDSDVVGADVTEVAELLNVSVAAAGQLVREAWAES